MTTAFYQLKKRGKQIHQSTRNGTKQRFDLFRVSSWIALPLSPTISKMATQILRVGLPTVRLGVDLWRASGAFN